MIKINHHFTRGLSLILFVCLIAQACGSNPLIPKAIQSNKTIQPIQANLDPSAMNLLNEQQGWLLMGNQLFWTDTSGDSWKNITPSSLGVWSIAAVDFINPSIGWLALISIDNDGTNHFAISKTENSGRNWDFQSLYLFSPGDPASIVGKISLFVLDQQNLWMVIKRQSSAPFNLGTLFKTHDAGKSWEKLDLPGGEPVYFINTETGWTLGGSGEDSLYTTQNGGLTWEPQVVLSKTEGIINYQLPSIDATGHGLLAVFTTLPNQTRLAIYQSSDYGKTWFLSSETKTASSGGQSISFSIPTDGQWTATLSDGQVLQGSIKGTETIARASLIGGAPGTAGQSALPDHPLPAQGIYHLDMASETNGWAVRQSGDCTTNPSANNSSKPSRTCSTSVNLLHTTDGGLTWKTLALPVTNAIAPNALGNQITTVATQGFDTCVVPTTDQMATWIAHSPYTVFNLYIGGSWLGCNKAKMSLITNDYIGHLSQQGWKFIPTWVGLQAPCYCPPDPNNPNSTCNKRPQMSSTASTAYTQGVTEANSALDTASNLGLAGSDKSGTIIYYDMEAFNSSDLSCRSAVSAFLEGWTNQLHARSNYSGVYGTSCGLGKLDLSNNKNVPDDIWLAYWLIPFQYRSNASVYGLYCYSDSVFTNHQRIHQYSGEHNETWSGVTVGALDNNVIDGAVSGWINNGTDCPQLGGVILYWNPNYKCANTTGDTGYRIRQSTGWINVNDGTFDNKAASVIVPACYTVNLYSDANLSGSNVTLTSDVAELSTLGNYPDTTIPVKGSISSMLVLYDPLCQNNYFPLMPYSNSQ